MATSEGSSGSLPSRGYTTPITTHPHVTLSYYYSQITSVSTMNTATTMMIVVVVVCEYDDDSLEWVADALFPNARLSIWRHSPLQFVAQQ